MKITLDPILPRLEFEAPIERELVAYFEEVIFDPIRQFLMCQIRDNGDTSALWAALSAGIIWYSEGRFYGKFNANISRELRALGAGRFSEGFSLETGQLPIALRAHISELKHRSETTHERISSLLAIISALGGSTISGINLTNTVDKLMEDLHKQFVGTVSKVAGLSGPMGTPEELKSEIQKQLLTNTDLAATNYTLEAAAELRAKVTKNLDEGGRLDRLAGVIESMRSAAKRKATDIAESEIRLATAKFREERYRELGSTQYVWCTKGDNRVRPTHGESNNHRILDGRTFSWDSPPVVDPAVGRRRHPGEDYNCRCWPRAILNV